MRDCIGAQNGSKREDANSAKCDEAKAIDNQSCRPEAALSIAAEGFALIKPFMSKWMSIWGALAVVATATASAEDFPLTFRTLPAKDVMSFPSGSGVYGRLRLAKPAKLRRELRAMSAKPFYGECGDARAGTAFLFRLDESRGEGKGYDQLIVDLNQNGDLTDDPVTLRPAIPTDRRTGALEHILFGPIQAPADKALVGGRPVYFAQVLIFNRELLNSSRTDRDIMFGQVQFKPGWYLDTTVALNGLKQKVGVCDSDCNLRLGDIARSQISSSGMEKSWSFRAGDEFLLDADGSGEFNADRFQSETCPFGPILYLDGKAYKVTLAPDCKSLHVEPWAEPLATVALQPRGDQVRSVTLAWQPSGGPLQLIRPAVADGKVMVPPGDYQLYTCTLVGKTSPSNQVMVSGTQHILQLPERIAAGTSNIFECGAPLDIKVTAVKTKAAGGFRVDADPTLRINANVVGVDGEVYTTFQQGGGFRSQPPKPSFTIQAGGKTVATGNLEYG
jgi:hypothetical protein